MATTAPRKTAAARKAAAPPADPATNGHRTPKVAAGPDPLPDTTPAAQAETAIEDIPEGAIAVPLGTFGDVVHVIPREQWRSSALTALHQGDLETWAKACLHRPDYETIWVGLDPTIGEIQEMLRAWSKLTGEDLGKAGVQRGSLRTIRNR